MPTYDYECQRCSHSFEAFQAMSDEPLKKCPECGGKVRRLIGPGAGLLFKGGGFYITDYRSKDYAQKAKSESGGGSEGGGSSGGSDAAGSSGEGKPKPAAEGGKPAAKKSSAKKRARASD